jgi:Uma2 family endonuclease
MSVAPPRPVTYEDYLLLPEDRRYEIVDGDLFMTPAPTPYHQIVLSNLQFLLESFVRERQLGKAIFAPCDVVLSEIDVVQPDILFVSEARLAIIGEKYISAAPDLVVEVLSPSTASRDQTIKTKLYERSGVRELWIASPEARTVEVLVNDKGVFRRDAIYGYGDSPRSLLLPGLEIPLAGIF